ncbi:MAG TPA: hypothetical protein VLM20_06655 [Methylophilaceae bacterium]|nr:hypothetical protein [Methylophilaceae bacterium]
MGNSSTQFPFMLAALIAVMIHAFVSEPKLDSEISIKQQTNNIKQTDQTVASLLISTPVKTKQ